MVANQQLFEVSNQEPGPVRKWRGVYYAIVSRTEDPDNPGQADEQGRVKVRFPWLPGDQNEESHWARIVTPMAGNGRGTYFKPKAGQGTDGDQVLVIFEQGNINRPLIVGSIWSVPQPAPQQNAGDGHKNPIHVIKSPSGHRLIFDQTEGRESVTLVDSTKKNKVVLDTANDCITIESADGDIDIRAGKSVRIHSDAVNMSAGSFALSGREALRVATTKSLDVVTSGVLGIKGATVHLNPDGSASTGGTPSPSTADAASPEQAAEAQLNEAGTLGPGPKGLALPDTETPTVTAPNLQPPVVGEPMKCEMFSTAPDGTRVNFSLIDAIKRDVIGQAVGYVVNGAVSATFDAFSSDCQRVSVVTDCNGEEIEHGPVGVDQSVPEQAPQGNPTPSTSLLDPANDLTSAAGTPGGSGGSDALRDAARRGLDADSFDEFSAGYGRDGSRLANEAVAGSEVVQTQQAAQAVAAQAAATAAAARRDGENATDVEGRVEGGVGAAEGEAAGAQYSAESAARGTYADGPRAVGEARATLDVDEADARAHVGGQEAVRDARNLQNAPDAELSAAEVEARSATADARDPMGRAQREGHQAADAAEDAAIGDQREAVRSANADVDQAAREAGSTQAEAKDTVDNPDDALRREAREELDD